jgi:4-amino-4-deoxy-L-arabinose transferase-like glycosyltransferase
MNPFVELTTGADSRFRGAIKASAPGRLDRRDVGVVLAILVAYGVALLLMPLAHNFAYLDDWTYARAVENVVNGQGFQPSEYAQATLVATTYWGALFAWLFGFSFTMLTAATMTLSAVATLTFYVLLRRLGFTPGIGVLGTAILALNPYYLVLSYSFMTEIPFVAALLLSCLCYFEGLRSGRLAWLWVGGSFAALAYLTRQFGLVVPVAMLLWLAWTRRWSWPQALASALLPILAALGYAVWTSRFGPTLSAGVGREEIVALLRPFTWLNRAAHFIYLAAFLPGLTLPLWSRVRRARLIGVLAAALAVAVYILWQVKGALVEQGQSTINDLSYSWLNPPFANPTLIYCLGVLLGVWLIAGIVQHDIQGYVAFFRRPRSASPAAFLYLVPTILFAGTYVVSAGFLDRYWLPLFPFLIAGGLASLRGRSLRGLAPVFVALLVVAGYGVVVHLDDYAYHAAAWEAGRFLVQQNAPLDKIASYTGWEGYYLGDEALARLGSHDLAVVGRVFPPDQIIDPQYQVSTAPVAGYEILARFPYRSIRAGLVTQEMLALRRVGSPP